MSYRESARRLRRLEELEAAQQPDVPPYLSLTLEEWEHRDTVTQDTRAGAVKVYVGVSPDDWNRDDTLGGA